MTVGPVGIVCIPARRQVLDPECKAALDADSEPRVQAADSLVSPVLGGAPAADIVRATRRVEHDPGGRPVNEWRALPPLLVSMRFTEPRGNRPFRR